MGVYIAKDGSYITKCYHGRGTILESLLRNRNFSDSTY